MTSRWTPPRMWVGGECYIIGGGPSLLPVFGVPDPLIFKVKQKILPPSALSEYLKPIHHKHVIAVNSAYLLGDWIDVVFFGDKNWYLHNRTDLAKIPKLKITCSSYFLHKPRNFEGVKYIPKNKKNTLGISKDPTCINWNHNSGASAINLAIHFGVKTIYLLGFDMKEDRQYGRHWHKEYSDPAKPIDYVSLYSRHLAGFPLIAETAQQMGISIVNLSPDSAINVFRTGVCPWKAE